MAAQILKNAIKSQHNSCKDRNTKYKNAGKNCKDSTKLIQRVYRFNAAVTLAVC